MIVSTEICFICGRLSHFQFPDNFLLLREAVCSNCRSSIRSSDITKIIIKTLLGYERSLLEVREFLKKYKILEAASYGGINNSLKGSPNYTYSEYFDNIPNGHIHKGILCVDLQNILFADETFDLIITQDVFEHIKNKDAAFGEVKRVLRKGGYHIFTVPVHENKKTSSRDNLPPVYHGDPLRDGVLVYTDFGNDLCEILNEQYMMPTKQIMVHKFYEKHEISDVDKDYNDYLQKKDRLLEFFKYNSLVFVSKKV